MMQSGGPPDKPSAGGRGDRIAPRQKKRAPGDQLAALARLDTNGANGVDDAPGAAVESSSDLKKSVGPASGNSGADEDETREGDGRRDSASLFAEDSVVKPFPTGIAEDAGVHMSDDKPGDADLASSAALSVVATATAAAEPATTTTDDKGKVVSLHKYTRATLTSVASLFDVNDIDLKYDVALGAVVLTSPPPWGRDDKPGTYPKIVKRPDELRAARWIASNYIDDAGPMLVADAMKLCAMNPTRQIDSVTDAVLAFAGTWDREERLDVGLAQHLGVDDGTPETRRRVADWWVGSVRRMLWPGAPLEDILLIDRAGALRDAVYALTLLLPAPLVLDAGSDFDCRFGVAAKRLVGKGFVVVSDVLHHTVRELATLVSFAAREGDGDDLPPRHAGFALVASEKRTDHIPARCVLATSHHRPNMTFDTTVLRQWLAETIDRVGEYVPHRRGPTFRKTDDPWEVPIYKWLFQGKPVMVTTNAVLTACLKVPLDRREKRHQDRVAAVLAGLGWAKGRAPVPDIDAAGEAKRGSRQETRVRVWLPPEGFYSEVPTTVKE